jgi:hypothetical protein
MQGMPLDEAHLSCRREGEEGEEGKEGEGGEELLFPYLYSQEPTIQSLTTLVSPPPLTLSLPYTLYSIIS